MGCRDSPCGSGHRVEKPRKALAAIWTLPRDDANLPGQAAFLGLHWAETAWPKSKTKPNTNAFWNSPSWYWQAHVSDVVSFFHRRVRISTAELAECSRKPTCQSSQPRLHKLWEDKTKFQATGACFHSCPMLACSAIFHTEPCSCVAHSNGLQNSAEGFQCSRESNALVAKKPAGPGNRDTRCRRSCLQPRLQNLQSPPERRRRLALRKSTTMLPKRPQRFVALCCVFASCRRLLFADIGPTPWACSAGLLLGSKQWRHRVKRLEPFTAT